MDIRSGCLQVKPQYIPCLYDFTDEEIRDQATRFLGETPEKVEKGLEVMRDYIQRRQLKCYAGDEFLLKFLRVKKFRHVDSCKQIGNFIKTMENAYKKFGPIDADIVKKVVQKNISGCLPYRDLSGRFILYFRLGSNEEMELARTVRTAMFGILYTMNQPSSQTCGISLIVDFKGLSIQELASVSSMGITLTKLMVGAPFRLGRIDMINASPFFRFIHNVIKPFMPRKASERLAIHHKVETLQRHYDKSILPDEFGGTAGPLSNDKWSDHIDAHIKDAENLLEKVI